MADTVRTKTELLEAAADNINGDISAQDRRDGVVSVLGVYGEIFVDEGSIPQTGIGTTDVKLTGFDTDSISDNVTVSSTNDEITINIDAAYEVYFYATFDGSSNTVFTFHMAKNGTSQHPGGDSKITTGGDVAPLPFRGFLNLVSGDVISVNVKADSAGKQLTLIHSGLMVKRIG